MLVRDKPSAKATSSETFPFLFPCKRIPEQRPSPFARPLLLDFWGGLNSLHTKDHISGLTVHNVSVPRTAICGLCFQKSVADWSHGLYETNGHTWLHFTAFYQCKCTLSSAAVFVLGSVPVYFRTDLAPCAIRSVKKKHALFHHRVNCLNIGWMI